MYLPREYSLYEMNTKNIKGNFLGAPIVLTGHYGSGKTEIAVNLALLLSRAARQVAIVDLDIANPYFRSREAVKRLSEEGVRLVSNAYDCDITADLPALSASVKSYIGDSNTNLVIDVGGNDSGARILNQYRDELKGSNAAFYIVVNVFRPETDNADKIIEMINSIEAETGTPIEGLINNSNMLRETKPIHVISGYRILKTVSERTGIPVVANFAEEKFADSLEDCCEGFIPISLYMRPRWLDS